MVAGHALFKFQSPRLIRVSRSGKNELSGKHSAESSGDVHEPFRVGERTTQPSTKNRKHSILRRIEPGGTVGSKKNHAPYPALPTLHTVEQGSGGAREARNDRAVTRRAPAKRYDSLARPCSFNGKTPGGRSVKRGGGERGAKRRKKVQKVGVAMVVVRLGKRGPTHCDPGSEEATLR